MLDTIVLSLPMNSFQIKYTDRFSPDAKWLFKPQYSASGKPLKAIYNPPKCEKSGYLPRLTLYRMPFFHGGQSIFLHIEYSVPKLLFGNNFVELRGMEDFMPALHTLHNALVRMGIETDLTTLTKANISSVHFSKNIILDRHIPCSLLIREMQKIDLSTKIDISQAKFRNGGQALHYHTSGYDIAIYDKIKDLQQAKKYGDKRSAENDNSVQFDLLENPRLPEVLRLEIRFKNKKIKEIAPKLGYNSMLTNVDFFNADFSRSILLHYWEKITECLFMLSLPTDDAESLISLIKQAHPCKRPTTVMQMLGFITAADALGVLGARQALTLPNTTFYRLKKDLKALNTINTPPRFSAIKAVKKQLEDFIPLEAADIGNPDLLNLKAVSGE